MKRTTCFLSKAVKWCASKCRALLGAFGFMLPAVTSVTTGKKTQWRRLRKLAPILLFLFLLIAPILIRPQEGASVAVFACPVRIRSYCYSSGFDQTSFSYTGTYTWISETGTNWRLKFLTSGVFTPSKPVTIDLFLVGGGGGGGSGSSGGGGGGYTGTWSSVSLSAGTGYSIVVGSGGSAGVSLNSGGNGGASTAFGYSANGGYGGKGYNTGRTGGNGGSGGGGAGVGGGGTNGSNGGTSSFAGGTGQATTTKEFGSADGTLYSGGGGASQGSGGAGGGGAGGNLTGTGVSGAVNTGGGGGASGGNGPYTGGAGGSGICVIRNHR